MKIILASRNVGKLQEIREILRDLNAEVVNMEDAGVVGEAVEDGATFEENALKKARYVHEQKRGSDCWALSDDTGLCIDALGGKPGIFSARYAGEGASEQVMAQKILQEMAQVPEDKRQVRFEAAVALIAPDGRELIFPGTVKGRITLEPRGVLRPKLPYDLIFIPEGYDQTFDEMPDAQKNALSHRGHALEKVKQFLRELA